MTPMPKLKHFYKNVEKSVDTEGDPAQFNQNFNQDNDQVQKDFSDIFNKARNEGPITRAKAKLIKYKDAAQLALILLKSETDNINSLSDPSDNCAQCESEDNYFANKHTLQFLWLQLKLVKQCCKQWRLKLMKTEANKINSAEDRCHSTVSECFCEPLMKVAYKLLSRDKATFEELTPSGQKLWKSFETDKIYRLLTREPDTVPEFRFNWYTITTADGSAEFIPDQVQPLQTKATIARPPTATPAVPSPEIRVPKASTSARAALPSSSLSSNPSTTPSSPTASTSGAVPQTIPAGSTSGSSTTPSKSPSLAPAPSPAPKSAPKSAKGSGCKLRAHPEVNYRDLHLGCNLLLGR
jgi:hypothetical protein